MRASERACVRFEHGVLAWVRGCVHSAHACEARGSAAPSQMGCECAGWVRACYTGSSCSPPSEADIMSGGAVKTPAKITFPGSSSEAEGFAGSMQPAATQGSAAFVRPAALCVSKRQLEQTEFHNRHVADFVS